MTRIKLNCFEELDDAMGYYDETRYAPKTGSSKHKMVDSVPVYNKQVFLLFFLFHLICVFLALLVFISLKCF